MQFARRRSSLRGLVFGFSFLTAVAVPRLARAELPSLERTIELARARALGVADALGDLGVANAQLAGARVSSFGNPYTEAQIDKGLATSQTIQAMTFTYFPVDIAGQRGKRIDEAERLIDWRKLGLVGARASATGEAVGAYGELLVGVTRVTFAKAGEQTARDEAKYFQGRFDAKDTTIYEKSLADAEVARWVQTRAEAEVRVASAHARYGQVTGVANVDGPPANADVAPPGLRGPWDDTHLARVIDKAPVIARLQAERIYWESSTERYQRERVPPVSFEIIAGRGSVGEARLGAGAVITFPIARRYQGEIARAESGRENASRQLALYRSVVETRLRAAREVLSSVAKALQELDAAGIPALEKAVEASSDGYKAGKIELTRVLLARRDLSIAKGRRLDLIEASWRAYADLTVLSGELP